MFRRHNQITVVAPIAKGKKAALSNALDRLIGYQVGTPAVRRALTRIPTLHFISMFVLEVPGRADENHLIIEASFDGRADHFLQALTHGLRHPLSLLLKHCVTHPGEDVHTFLRRHLRRPDCFYVSCPGLPRPQIEQEHKLLERLQARSDRIVMDGANAYPDQDTVIKTLRDDALDAGALTGAPSSIPFLVKYGEELTRGLAILALMAIAATCVLAFGEWPDLNRIGREPYFLVGIGLLIVIAAHRVGERTERLFGTAMMLLAVLASAAGAAAISKIVPEMTFMAARYALMGLALMVGVFILFLIQIETAEQTDHIESGWLDINHMRDVCRAENAPGCMQNHFVNVSVLKRGRLRMWSIRAMMLLIHTLGVVYFNRGRLGGIPSIHFARWIVLDGKEFADPLLVFMTNYDASWDSYLGDFVDGSSQGVSGIWSNTHGFPRTWGLMAGGGSRFEKQFKAYARSGMLRSQGWFSAYPNVSVREKLSNARVRRLLMGDPAKLKIAEKADLLHFL